MLTSSLPRRESTVNPERGFASQSHNFGRMALQFPEFPLARSPRRGRMGSVVAANILTPRKASGRGENDEHSRWFLTMTPEERRVPKNRQQLFRWIRTLNVDKERGILKQLNPVKQEAACWPCDRCSASKDGISVMGSLKVFEGKQQCVEVRRLVQAEHLEVMTARAQAAAQGTHEVVDTVESLLQLGLTEFEASMEQFERADRSLDRLRKNAVARPPELHYQPEAMETQFGQLRDRYYYHRGKDVAELLKVVDVDRSQETFANGGPVVNRVQKDPLEGLDFEFDVVGLPGSPLGFSVLKYRKSQLESDEGNPDAIPPFQQQRDDETLRNVTIDEKPSTDTRTSDRLYLNRDTQTRELSVSLANRNRFCNKPLWVDIDAEIKSRENTSDSTRLPKPTHENKHKKVFRRAPERANRPGEDKKRLVLRESMRFMASSPVTQEDSKECTQQDGRQLERASIFMTSSSKYAPDSKLSQKQTTTRSGMTIQPLTFLNNTI